MKLCPVCGELNDDNAVVCRNQDCCSTLLFNDYEETKERTILNLTLKDRNKKILKLIATISYISFVILLSILNLTNNSLTLIQLVKPIFLIFVGYLCIFHSDIIFTFAYLFKLKDSSECDISDMYRSLITLFGYLLLIYSLTIFF
ncbi:hypothetical protein BH721_09030 [Clostridium baratii]|uniref:hypothetical protein n=1 Tax=Clostridium baratii TaxID=1561 RepID=UPI0009A3AC9D|nr:hypothetical protein [Clostridium baratii]OPF52963.1 hypothetical protein A1M12_00300 [Clostridium baratii]OPF53817.1 hypothetical protein BH721_09030 [Clostridium baratii]OPF54333.1 hypothetical protein BH724_02100 [Clostridium baratii]OPF60805.1 hypothetical protein BH725_00770 [Clostridium baratii]